MDQRIFVDHVKANITVYLFMTSLLVTGIVFGAIVVNSMTFVQKQDLFFQINQYFQRIDEGDPIVSIDLFKKSFTFHLQYLILLGLLGLTIIGLPLVWLLVFLKGLVIGFSVGFIVNQLGLKGLILATVSIAPQNVIIIPVYIVAASMANIFSLLLFQKIIARSSTISITKPFLQYVTVFIALCITALFGSLLETFVSYEAFKITVQSFNQ
ncbi:MAG: stage II sporulation protein M [Bacilli bacterium]|nr:stage II sporulation protein M [Bacilli bacterium]